VRQARLRLRALRAENLDLFFRGGEGSLVVL
jgi:hypothetical protein